MKDKREIQILDILRQDSYISSQELAKQMNLSDRTVQTLIKRINENSADYGAKVTAKKRYGYRLEILEPEIYAKRKKLLACAAQKNVPDTPEKRMAYIIIRLLDEKGYVKLEQLCDELYVSKSTIASDMKNAKEILHRFSLSLESKPNRGICIRSTELNRRRCLAWMLKQSEEGQEGLEIGALKNEAEKIVDDLISEEHFEISDISRKNLVLHLCIAVRRIQNGCQLPENAFGCRSFDEESRRLAQKVIRWMQLTFLLEPGRGEEDYIALQLSCKRVVRRGGTPQNLVLDQQTQDIADEMILRVWEEFGQDFRGDFELRMNLCLHLVPMRSRMRFGFPAENPLLEEIKLEYPLAFEMAAVACAVMADQYWTGVSEDETGFVALLFALALEKKRSQTQKNVLLVCGSGKGSTELLRLKLQREFEGTIGNIEVCSLGQLEKADFSQIDYVFTTVAIDQIIPVPIVEMSWFLREEEMKEIRQRFEKHERISFRRYFSPQLFFAGIRARTKAEVLEFLCGRVVADGLCQPELLELVMAREALGRTTYGNAIAMPHPVRSVSQETFIAVGVLDRPVDWDGTQVRLVFLISVSITKNRSLDDFYKGITRLFTSRQMIDRLTESPSFETLEEIIKTLEE